MPHRSFVILGFISACSAPTAPRQPTAHTITGFASPESVALADDRRYVSNIGRALDPLAKDGDGFISELDASGAVLQLRAFAPLDAPKGMAILGNTLYVADIDRVVGFDRTSHARVFEASAPPAAAHLLNDLAVESDASLLVTDTLANTVYRLDLAERQLAVLAADLPGANGIVVDGPRAFVVGIGDQFAGGDLFTVDRATGATQRLGTAHGLFDGLAVIDDSLAVSDWRALSPPTAGSIALYRRDGTWLRNLAVPEPLHGPADFAYDAAARQLWVPRTLDHSVTVLDVR